MVPIVEKNRGTPSGIDEKYCSSFLRKKTLPHPSGDNDGGGPIAAWGYLVIFLLIIH